MLEKNKAKVIIEMVKEHKKIIVITILTFLTIIFFVTTALLMANMNITNRR